MSAANLERLLGIDYRTAWAVLHELRLATVRPGSRVHTDGHQSYAWVSQLGYQHIAMNLSSVPWAGGEIMPSVHRVASLVKRWWIGTHQGVMSGKHLDPYLSEFTFRFNRRAANHAGLRFYRLLEHAVRTPPSTYADFINRPA